LSRIEGKARRRCKRSKIAGELFFFDKKAEAVTAVFYHEIKRGKKRLLPLWIIMHFYHLISMHPASEKTCEQIVNIQAGS